MNIFTQTLIKSSAHAIGFIVVPILILNLIDYLIEKKKEHDKQLEIELKEIQDGIKRNGEIIY